LASVFLPCQSKTKSQELCVKICQGIKLLPCYEIDANLALYGGQNFGNNANLAIWPDNRVREPESEAGAGAAGVREPESRSQKKGNSSKKFDRRIKKGKSQQKIDKERRLKRVWLT